MTVSAPEREPEVSIGPEDAVVYLVFAYPDKVHAGQVHAEWLMWRQGLFTQVLKWTEENRPIDPVAFAEVTKHHELPKIWRACGAAGVKPESWADYVKILEQRYLWQKLVDLSDLNKTAQPGVNPKELVERVAEWLHGVEGKVSPVPAALQGPKQYAHKFLEEMGKRLKSQGPEIKFGYPSLDRKFWGLRRGQVLTVASRPGIGKSTFCLNISSHVLDQGKKVLYFSTEMDIVDKWSRLISIRTGVSAFNFISGNFTEDERRLVRAEAEKLYEEDKFLVCDLSAPSHYQVQAAIEERRPDVVVLDYLGLFQMPRADNRVHEVGAFMKQIQSVTRKTGVAMILVSQLNRGSEFRKDGERVPQLSDLRECGDIEQDSSSVILLYNKPGVDKEEAELMGNIPVVCDIAKNRHGPIGKVNMTFHRDALRIFETMV